MKHLLLITLSLFCSIFTSEAQESSNARPKFGAEFNLVWPFVPGVEIYTGKLSTEILHHSSFSGELLTGFLLRPGTKNDPNADIFREYGIGIGYRQYLAKGFHLELMLFPSYATEIKNKKDGKDYRGFAMTTEFYAGYRFDLIKWQQKAFYLLPQAGIGYTVISNLGPASEADAPFPALNLQIGVRF
jgi:hypothetical protein